MGRINTNVSAIYAQTHLQRSYRQLSESLQRLASGLRINRGADDPAGLIASESLRSEIAGLGQAVANSERASNVIATAEGALNEVAAMLVTIQELVVEVANSGAISDDEIRANQLQVDSAVESITRIANTTTFAGLRLLDGSLAYVTSGVDDTAIDNLDIYSVQFGTNSTVPVKVELISAAEKGRLEFRNSSIASAISIQVTGPEGSTMLSFAAGTKASAIAFAVNTVSDATGVEAIYLCATDPTSGIALQSTGYGASQFVSVERLPGSGTFSLVDSGGTSADNDEGKDARASVNGIMTVGDGLVVTLQSAGLDLDMRLDESFAAGSSTTFYVTCGGAKFQLGPEVNSNLQVNIGIRSIAASRLGNGSVGYLSQIVTGETYALVTGHARKASKIVQEEIREVSVLRGRLGAFEKNTLQTNINSLQITLENVIASESQIRDVDFAAETSNLTRSQILTKAGTSVLAIANTTPQSVLTLLGG